MQTEWTCVEQARYSFTDEQGQPRYMAAEDGKLYVTLSSGNVARLDANTLTFEKMVAVGQNPEHIIEEDGKLYLVNSGFRIWQSFVYHWYQDFWYSRACGNFPESG